MNRAVRGHPLLQSVVQVDFAGGYNAQTFFRKYDEQIIVDAELRELIAIEERINGAGRSQLGYTTFDDERPLGPLLSLASLWQLTCLLERDIKGITDPRYNPLWLTDHKLSLFPVKLRPRGPERLDRPAHVDSPRVLVVERGKGLLRVTTRPLRTKQVWAEGTFLFSGM